MDIVSQFLSVVSCRLKEECWTATVYVKATACWRLKFKLDVLHNVELGGLFLGVAGARVVYSLGLAWWNKQRWEGEPSGCSASDIDLLCGLKQVPLKDLCHRWVKDLALKLCGGPKRTDPSVRVPGASPQGGATERAGVTTLCLGGPDGDPWELKRLSESIQPTPLIWRMRSPEREK